MSIEHAQAESNELILDPGGAEQAVQTSGGRRGGVLGQNAVPRVTGELGHHQCRRHTFA